MHSRVQSAAETLQMLWKCKEQNQLYPASALRPSLQIPAALELIKFIIVAFWKAKTTLMGLVLRILANRNQ